MSKFLSNRQFYDTQTAEEIGYIQVDGKKHDINDCFYSSIEFYRSKNLEPKYWSHGPKESEFNTYRNIGEILDKFENLQTTAQYCKVSERIEKLAAEEL